MVAVLVFVFCTSVLGVACLADPVIEYDSWGVVHKQPYQASYTYGGPPVLPTDCYIETGCSASCGDGFRLLVPHVSGGVCGQVVLQVLPCNDQSCPVNCGWGEWSPWTQCQQRSSQLSGYGAPGLDITCFQSRTRRVKKSALHGGRPCRGETLEERYCVSSECAGYPGPPGLAGHNGVPGNDGNNGRYGAAGYPGPQGYEGGDGLPGIPGNDGTPGKNGVQGSRGPPGYDGIVGQQGERGLPGSLGLAGINGLRGKLGDIGPAGTQGKHGEPGIPGVDGTDGPPGPNGPPGYPGDQGAQGYVGSVGIQGVQGLTGDPGARGLPGYKGERGLPGLIVERTSSSSTSSVPDPDIPDVEIEAIVDFTEKLRFPDPNQYFPNRRSIILKNNKTMLWNGKWDETDHPLL